MKTKLMKMIEGGKLHDEQYVFSPKELQAIIDEACNNKADIIFKIFIDPEKVNASMSGNEIADVILNTPQPETGIKL